MNTYWPVPKLPPANGCLPEGERGVPAAKILTPKFFSMVLYLLYLVYFTSPPKKFAPKIICHDIVYFLIATWHSRKTVSNMNKKEWAIYLLKSLIFFFKLVFNFLRIF